MGIIMMGYVTLRHVLNCVKVEVYRSFGDMAYGRANTLTANGDSVHKKIDKLVSHNSGC
jgi:hypothetical protein